MRQSWPSWIKPAATVPLEDKYKQHVLTFARTASPGPVVTVRNVPADTLAIKVDAFAAPDAVFNGGHGECKGRLRSHKPGATHHHLHRDQAHS